MDLPLTSGEMDTFRRPKGVRAAARIALVVDTQMLQFLLVRHPRKGWEVPGGAIAPGEDAKAAALRELKEEAGVELKPDVLPRFAGTVPVIDDNGGCWIDVIYYVVLPSVCAISDDAEGEFSRGWQNGTELGNTHARRILALVSDLILGDRSP